MKSPYPSSWKETVLGTLCIWAFLTAVFFFFACTQLRADYVFSNSSTDTVRWIIYTNPEFGGTAHNQSIRVKAGESVRIPNPALLDGGPTHQIVLQVYNDAFDTDLTGNVTMASVDPAQGYNCNYLFGQIQVQPNRPDASGTSSASSLSLSDQAEIFMYGFFASLGFELFGLIYRTFKNSTRIAID